MVEQGQMSQVCKGSREEEVRLGKGPIRFSLCRNGLLEKKDQGQGISV